MTPAASLRAVPPDKRASGGPPAPDQREGIARWAAQPVLFGRSVSRRALLDVAMPQGDRTITVNVWRNHAIEPLLPLAAPYAAFGRWRPEWRPGDYDDSLGFAGWQAADLELLWLDRNRIRLAHAEFAAWLGERLAALRALTTAPLLLCTWGGCAEETAAIAAACRALPGCRFADLRAAADEAGVPLVDSRSAALAGTPLSAPAQLLLARRLACHWIPALALPPVKALALDLDHTLHHGVLGEDGVHGVMLTPAHAALQAHAKALRERGVFLALVSRNERADVERLFAERDDYPLKWTDFSAIEVSWGDKGEALARVAAALRIAPDAVLFVDDNPGELARVAAALPALPTVHAQPDAADTLRALEHTAGLWRFDAGSADDARRVADLMQAGERDRIAAAAKSPDELLRELQVRIAIRHDSIDDLPRAAELARKTNQFNLAVRRLPEAELALRIERADSAVATVSLHDRLADSGTVAVIAARREGRVLHVDELCISCRAMGRGLENALVLPAIAGMAALQGCAQVAFHVAETDRNGPARVWLSRLLGLAGVGPGIHLLSAAAVRDFVPPAAIGIDEEETDETL